MKEIKEALKRPPTLACYDLDGDMTVSVDTSSTALDTVLIQNGKPVAYASAALTSAQQNYLQIEKKILAIGYD